jgi:DNA-binding transcriptional LysR family regulator
MLTTLKIFLDVVDERSFTRAASMNYLTPSAVSQRIQILEDQIGQPLLIRDRKGVVVTEAGLIFYNASKDVLERIEQARRDMGSLTGNPTGRLRVGAVTSVGLHTLPPYIKTFLKELPGVNLSLEFMMSRDIYRGLLDHVLDLGLVACPERNSQFTAIVFGHDEMVVIAAPGHPLAKRGHLDLKSLDGLDFVSFEDGVPTGREVEGRLRQAGMKIKITQRFDNIETLKRAVEIGAGVSIVPRHTVEQECRARTLACSKIEEAGWDRSIAVVHPRGRKPNLPAQRFIDILLAEHADAPVVC